MRKIEERVKDLKYFTKKDSKTWYVQMYKDRHMESFFVTLIPGGLVMHGDYDGVIVMPYTRDDQETISWMAGCDCIGYFTEKVRLGNQYHREKEYSEEKARGELAREISGHFDGDDEMEKIFKAVIDFGCFGEKELRSRLPGDMSDEEFARVCKALEQVTEGTTESITGFQEICSNLESECDFSDLWELHPDDYTFQILWQFECLKWWAKNILDKQDVEHFELGEKLTEVPNSSRC
jgi:hypothetical protein